MIKLKLLTIVLLLISYSSYSQKLEIVSAFKNDDIIKVRLKLTNDKQERIAFYKPDLDSICDEIIGFDLETDDGIRDYFPCTYINHLDSIAISCANVIFLDYDETFEFNLELQLFEYLKSSKRIRCYIDYDYDIYFSDIKVKTNIFKGFLSSDFVTIQLKQNFAVSLGIPELGGSGSGYIGTIDFLYRSDKLQEAANDRENDHHIIQGKAGEGSSSYADMQFRNIISWDFTGGLKLKREMCFLLLRYQNMRQITQYLELKTGENILIEEKHQMIIMVIKRKKELSKEVKQKQQEQMEKYQSTKHILEKPMDEVEDDSINM